MRKLAVTAVVFGLIAGSLGSAHAAPKATTVFTDAAGDAGNQDSGIPGVDQSGMDLVKGTIARKGANLEFSVFHSAMPAFGAPPETFRFLWHFAVGNTQYRFTAKTVDIGKPDVIAQSGTERVGQIDTDGHFRLETCGETPLPAVLTLINCSAVEYLDGAFDPASKSFTMIVPLKSLKAKTGTVIAPGSGGAAGSGCQICWVPHYAERSLTPATIVDSTGMAKTYKVPK